MSVSTIKSPELGEDVAPFHKSDDTIALLSRRRSTAANFLGGPGPNAEELQAILEIGARVPDHRRVAPFRFLTFQGDERRKAGDVLADAFRAANPEADAAQIDNERRRFERAPCIVALISTVDLVHRTPEWEQVLTVGAVGQNLLVASSAFGFAAQWLTEWYSYDDKVSAAFGLHSDDKRLERVAGYFYIGTAAQPPKERGRPVISHHVSSFSEITRS
ncbi:MAG: nitroreductase [Pseudomonadota bacterium]